MSSAKNNGNVMVTLEDLENFQSLNQQDADNASSSTETNNSNSFLSEVMHDINNPTKSHIDDIISKPSVNLYQMESFPVRANKKLPTKVQFKLHHSKGLSSKKTDLPSSAAPNKRFSDLNFKGKHQLDYKNTTDELTQSTLLSSRHLKNVHEIQQSSSPSAIHVKTISEIKPNKIYSGNQIYAEGLSEESDEDNEDVENRRPLNRKVHVTEIDDDDQIDDDNDENNKRGPNNKRKKNYVTENLNCSENSYDVNTSLIGRLKTSLKKAKSKSNTVSNTSKSSKDQTLKPEYNHRFLPIIDDRMEIYFFDHGNADYFRTTDCPPNVCSEQIAHQTTFYATRFWAEIFGSLHIGVTFFITFFLQTYRFLLYSFVRSTFVGVLQITSDYLFKPIVTILFNGFLQPLLILMYNILASIKDMVEPIADILGMFLKPITNLVHGIRLISIETGGNYYDDGHQQHRRRRNGDIVNNTLMSNV